MTVTVATLMKHVLRSDGGCWLWTGAVASNGYSQMGDAGRTRSAHRVSYELHVGPIPDGLQIDHLCFVRRCINPDHLEPVTQAENQRRRFHNRCPRGHDYTPENTAFRKDRGTRVCCTCRTAQGQRARARIAAELVLAAAHP